MEWLKAILEKAKIEDGKLDIDGVMSTVNSEFPKYAVPKNVFNDKVTELKTANKTIEDLKQSNADNEGLQKKITEYEGEIETLKTNALNTAKTFALKEQLAKAGVTDADYLIYNGTIDGQVSSLGDLEAKSNLFTEFKAVKDGNVWYTGKNLYQATDTVGELISDIHLMLTDGDASQMTFLEKMK